MFLGSFILFILDGMEGSVEAGDTSLFTSILLNIVSKEKALEFLQKSISEITLSEVNHKGKTLLL